MFKKSYPVTQLQYQNQIKSPQQIILWKKSTHKGNSGANWKYGDHSLIVADNEDMCDAMSQTHLCTNSTPTWVLSRIV